MNYNNLHKMHPWITFQFSQIYDQVKNQNLSYAQILLWEKIHQVLCVRVQCLSTSSTDINGPLND